MKTLILAVTFATLAFTGVTPVQAATSSITSRQTMEFGRGCDTKRDIKAHPRCK